MSITNVLINAPTKSEVFSTMDECSKYNQIPIIKNENHKIVFIFLGSDRAYKQIMMPFGLKNIGDTYQMAMKIFVHDFFCKNLEV